MVILTGRMDKGMAHNVFNMKWNKVYECLVKKVERKGHMADELNEIIIWLTGYDDKKLSELSVSDIDYGDFFKAAPKLNPNRNLIKGKICGVQVEMIDDPFIKFVRQLDKLTDELANGIEKEKIFRHPVTVDDYIETVEVNIQPLLFKVKNMIRETIPMAKEKISWGMPTWYMKTNIIHFATAKKHFGIYPGSECVEHFSDKLLKGGYRFSKGAIQFPYDKPFDEDFFREIVHWCKLHNS